MVQENREGQINLNTSEWLILSKIDGQRSVKTIAQASGLSVFDAAKMLYGLITTNLIRLHEPLATHPPRATPATAGPPARGGSTSDPGLAVGRAGNPTPAGPAVSPHAASLLNRLGRMRDECIALLGPVGESVVTKHYLKARAEIERGAGAEALEDAVQQIARAASILKGPSASDSILEQLKSLR